MANEDLLADDDLGPWRTIWYAPRRTIRWILDNDPTYDVKTLAVLAGIADAVGRAMDRAMGDTFPTLTVAVLAVGVGAASGLVLLYLIGAVVRWVGTRLGGRMTHEEARAALAWAYPPLIATLAVALVQYAIFGDEVFKSFAPTVDASPMVVIPLAVATVLLALWSFGLFVVNLSEAQGFTLKRALANIALAFLLVAIPLVAAAMLAVFLIQPASPVDGLRSAATSRSSSAMRASRSARSALRSSISSSSSSRVRSTGIGSSFPSPNKRAWSPPT